MTSELVNPFNTITDISKNKYTQDVEIKDDLITQNFMDSLEYYDNYIKFLYLLEGVINIQKVEFIPTFISLNVSSKLNLNVIPEVNEMRLFEINMDWDVVEKIEKNEEKFVDICDDIKYDGNKVIFILK